MIVMRQKLDAWGTAHSKTQIFTFANAFPIRSLLNDHLLETKEH